MRVPSSGRTFLASVAGIHCVRLGVVRESKNTYSCKYSIDLSKIF
jgi:hypothetical protein